MSKKGIIIEVFIDDGSNENNKLNNLKRLHISLKKHAVDIELTRKQIKAKYKAKKVFFHYDTKI